MTDKSDVTSNPQKRQGHFYLEDVFPNPLEAIANAPPSIVDLAGDCVFVLDANILITTHKVGEGSLRNLESIYKRLTGDNRLYVPHRALQEYVKNRGNDALRHTYNELNAAYNNLNSFHLPSKRAYPMLEATEEYIAFVNVREKAAVARKELLEATKALMDRLQDWCWDDPVSKLYMQVFTEDKVIFPELTPEELSSDSEWRNKHDVPPAFADKGKVDKGIGDLLIWHSIVALSKKLGRSIVFVTNDTKEDWQVYVRNEKKTTPLMARPELSAEFYAATKKHFGIVSYEQFLTIMKASRDTIEEVVKADHPFGDVTGRIHSQLTAILAALRPVTFGEVMAESTYWMIYELAIAITDEVDDRSVPNASLRDSLISLESDLDDIMRQSDRRPPERADPAIMHRCQAVWHRVNQIIEALAR